MRITLTISAIILTALLASCSSRGSNEGGGDQGNQTGNGGSTLGGGTDATTDGTDNTDDSYVGLWDFSEFSITEYQLWGENSFIVYDYQADGSGNGGNCYELTETPYTRVGNEVTFEGVTYTVIRNGDTLNFASVIGNLVEAFTADDLEECLL